MSDIKIDISLLSDGEEILKNQSATQKAIKLIDAYIGIKPTLVGSHAMGVGIPGSDIDFAVGINTSHEKTKLKNILMKYMEFRGERPATLETTRFLFCTRIEDTHIDLNVMDIKDYDHLVHGMKRARAELTDEEKSSCIAEKIRLKKINKSEFEKYKLNLYQRFCPDLLWLPDFQIRAMIEKRCVSRQESLPAWLIAKKQNGKNEIVNC